MPNGLLARRMLGDDGDGEVDFGEAFAGGRDQEDGSGRDGSHLQEGISMDRF